MNPNQFITRDPETGRKRVQTVNNLDSKTVQSDRNGADIRHILAKYEQTGVLMSRAAVDLAFRDVSEFEDFHDVMLQAKVAEAAFMRLPSKVREVFDHEVSKWLDAAHDDDKFEELRPRLERTGFLEPLEAPSVAIPPAGEEPA